MSQIIIEQQFHYTVEMTSNKHFLIAIYANRNDKHVKFLTLAQVVKTSKFWNNGFKNKYLTLNFPFLLTFIFLWSLVQDDITTGRGANL